MNTEQNELIKRIDDRMSGTLCLYDAEMVDLLRDCRSEIERLSKPYVPMTDDEFQLIARNNYDAIHGGGWALLYELYGKAVQNAAIKRYNEQRGVK